MPDDQFKTDDSDNNINKDKKNGSETKPPIKPEGKTDADTDDLVVLSNHEFLSKQVKDSKPEKSIKEEKLDETKVGSQIIKNKQETKTEEDFPFSDIDEVFEEMEQEEKEPKPKEEKKEEPKPVIPKMDEPGTIPSDIQKETHMDPFADQVFIPAETDKKEPAVEQPIDPVIIPEEADKRKPSFDPVIIPPEADMRKPSAEPVIIPEEADKKELELDFPMDPTKQPELEFKKEKKEEDVFVLEDNMIQEGKRKTSPGGLPPEQEAQKADIQEEPKKTAGDTEQNTFELETNKDFLIQDQQDQSVPPPETPELTSLSDETGTEHSKKSEDPYSPQVISSVPELEEFTERMHPTDLKKASPKDLKKQGYDPSLYPEEDHVEISRAVESKKFYKPDEGADTGSKTGIPKKYLIVGVIALTIMIVGSYFLFFSGEKDTGSETKTSPISTRRDKTQITKGEKPDGPVQRKRLTLKDRKYNVHIKRARDLYKNGKYEEAKKNAEIAADIKPTKEISTLLKNISVKMEKKAEKLLAQKEKKSLSTPLSDKQEYEKAKKENIIEAYKKYLERYPAGEYYSRARLKIKQLEAKAQHDLQKEVQAKIKQRKRIRLRSTFQKGKKETLEGGINKGKRVRNIFEKTVIGGDKVIIDYNTGLIWHLWKRPMNFEQARLFAIRRYAGFNKWRLPTAEELSSVLKMDLNYFTSLPRGKREIWTGDLGVHELRKTVWAMDISSGNLIESQLEELKYLCAVFAVK